MSKIGYVKSINFKQQFTSILSEAQKPPFLFIGSNYRKCVCLLDFLSYSFPTKK